jgi:hypothetical protein
MPHRVSSPLIALLALAFVACARGVDPVAPATEASYTANISGDLSYAMSGFSFVQQIPNGFTEQPSTGTTTAIDVTLLSFTLMNLTGPQVNLGLLGDVRPGTYRVRTGDTRLGSAPEFYGDFVLANQDGTRRSFAATEGTVTISSVAPVIEGAFRFHSAMSFLWPADPQVGTTVHSTPANLDAIGSFRVRSP